jgi:hypothetical protein
VNGKRVKIRGLQNRCENINPKKDSVTIQTSGKIHSKARLILEIEVF